MVLQYLFGVQIAAINKKLISKNIYLLFFAALFFSCSNYLPYSSANQTKSITNIPLKKSVDNVDCFFNNQAPAKPFYKVNIVEVTSGTTASYDELIMLLKNKAKQNGLDAVMILNKQQEIAYENLTEKISIKDTSVNYYRQLATPYQKLSAIGIKYIENITYLDTIVKTTLFKCSSTSISNSAVHFDFYGNLTAIDNKLFDNFYSDSIEPFDIDKHLLAGVKNWQYKTDEVLTTKVIAFKKEINTIEVIDVKIDFDNLNKIEYKILNTSRNKNIRYTLKVERDREGKINKKILYQKNNIIWVEDIFYNNNLLTGIKRYRLLSNGNEDIIFTAVNQFYSVKDLPTPAQ